MQTFTLTVDKSQLAKQIGILSKLTETLTDDAYEETIGAIQLLEEVFRQASPVQKFMLGYRCPKCYKQWEQSHQYPVADDCPYCRTSDVEPWAVWDN